MQSDKYCRAEVLHANDNLEIAFLLMWSGNYSSPEAFILHRDDLMFMQFRVYGFILI